MDKEKLTAQTKKALAEAAKRKGIKGWHAMTKDQLVRALLRQSRPTGTRAAASRSSSKSSSRRSTPSKPKRSNGKATARPIKSNGRRRPSTPVACSADRDISTRGPGGVPTRTSDDSISLEVLDPFWLHVQWILSGMSVARAEAALGNEWHGARPILRLLDVTSEDTTSSTEMTIRDIHIYGGVTNWFIDVRSPGRAYRVDIGYLSRKGRFFPLSRSNTVASPQSTSSDTMEANWDAFRKQVRKSNGSSKAGSPPRTVAELRRLFDGTLRVPMSGGALSDGRGNGGVRRARSLTFDLEAELIVYGETSPDAAVSLLGESVALRSDGSFTMRYSLPEGRQIIPAVATSRDGAQELTVILAVERNTKHLEPIGAPTEAEGAAESA
jgi:uncharacterized protein